MDVFDLRLSTTKLSRWFDLCWPFYINGQIDMDNFPSRHNMTSATNDRKKKVHVCFPAAAWRVCACWLCPARRRAEQTAVPVGRETQLDVWLQLTPAKLWLVPSRHSPFTDTRCWVCAPGASVCACYTWVFIMSGSTLDRGTEKKKWAATLFQLFDQFTRWYCRTLCCHYTRRTHGGSVLTRKTPSCGCSATSSTRIINNKVEWLVSLCLRIHLLPH